MKLPLYPALLIACSIITAGGNDISMSKFYEDNTLQEYKCSVSFQDPMFFDCACVTGLWILYESCSENVTIAGGDASTRCSLLGQAPVSKAIQIVRNRQELAVVGTNGKVTLLKPATAKAVGTLTNYWALVTGSNWTLIDTTGKRICVSVMKSDAYCFFTQLEKLEMQVIGVEKNCEQQYDYFIEPEKCELIRGKSENICESRLRTRKHTLVKREAEVGTPEETSTAITSSNENVPWGAVRSSNNEDTHSNETTIDSDDEDFTIFQANANKSSTTLDPTTLLADEILAFMNIVVDNLVEFLEVASETNVSVISNATKRGLELVEDFVNSSNSNPLNVTYSNPPYEFLDIAKRITQKTCPKFYVKKTFLDLAVATFINVQRVQFKFPETTFKPSGFRRVLNYLRKCEQNATKFNFTDPSCNGTVDGNYTAFDETLELILTSDFTVFDRDPIIETVWKIFYNAHSYCYPFFENSLDHHRFTTWMIPLFQNQINDIWMAGKTTELYFNGIFGNQIMVQKNLAYCAVSSRLESTYPFDLPRPARVAEFGASLLGNDTGKRRKRDLDYGYYLRTVKFGNCLDTSKPLLCPDHVKSSSN